MANDSVSIETQVFQLLLVMLADSRRASGRYFSNAVHLNGTADRGGKLLAGSFKRNDNLICSQLRIIDDFVRLTHGAKGHVNAVENFIPMRHGLRSKNPIEYCRQLWPILRQLGGI